MASLETWSSPTIFKIIPGWHSFFAAHCLHLQQLILEWQYMVISCRLLRWSLGSLGIPVFVAGSTVLCLIDQDEDRHNFGQAGGMFCLCKCQCCLQCTGGVFLQNIWQFVRSPNKFWIGVLFVLWCCIHIYHIPGRKSEVICDDIDQIYVVSKMNNRPCYNLCVLKIWKPCAKAYLSLSLFFAGFHCPWVPLLPIASILVNVYLLVNLGYVHFPIPSCNSHRLLLQYHFFLLWCGDVHCCCDHLLK